MSGRFMEFNFEVRTAWCSVGGSGSWAIQDSNHAEGVFLARPPVASYKLAQCVMIYISTGGSAYLPKEAIWLSKEEAQQFLDNLEVGR